MPRYRLTTPTWHKCLIPVAGGYAWDDRELPAGTIGELVTPPKAGKIACLKVGEVYVYAPQWSRWQEVGGWLRQTRLAESRGRRSQYVRSRWPAAKPKGRKKR